MSNTNSSNAIFTPIFPFFFTHGKPWPSPGFGLHRKERMEKMEASILANLASPSNGNEDRGDRNGLRHSAASDGSATGSSPRVEVSPSPSSPSKTAVKVTKVKARAMKVEAVHPELPNTPESP